MSESGSGLFRSLRELYFRSPISDWRLGSSGTMDLAPRVARAWPGDSEHGRAIIDGAIKLGEIPIGDVDSAWRRIPENEEHASYLHSFSWLGDLKEIGGEAARRRSRDLVSGWIAGHGSWHPFVWRPDVLGERIANWLGAYEFFCESADDAFHDSVTTSLERQFRHLCRDLDAAPDGLGRLRAASGLAVAGVALGCEEDTLASAERWLTRALPDLVHEDGGVTSRAPHQHVEAMVALIDFRNAFRARGREVPAQVDTTIDAMCAMLRLWRHGDGRLALFHRSTEGSPATLDSAIAQSESRRKVPLEAAATGFQRLSAGRTCVIIDAGRPSGLDHVAHASPLAFEMSSGKQRLIVNCGTSPGDPRWQGPLRASAAHSMLVIDDHNATGVSADGMLLSGPPRVTVSREQQDGATLLVAEHDGYRERFGLLHRRRLYLSASGDDLRGEDQLIYTGDPGDVPNEAVVRFHLHPRISASVIQSGASVLIRPPSGGGWRMRTDAGLGLNESVYFGTGTRQRAEQIVISRSLEGIREKDEITIKWALRREDARGA